MPRPLLEIWRGLNRNSSEPSSLLARAVADLKRELSTPAVRRKRLIADLGRSTMSPSERAVTAAAKPRRLSLTQQAIADIVRQDDLVARALGTPRPIEKDHAKQHKRKHGGGRKPSLTPAQIADGIRILRSQQRMTVDAARWTLRAAGLHAKDSALYTLVIKPAYASVPIRK